MNLTHFYPYMQALNATPNTTIPQHTMPSQIHYHQQQQQQQQQQRDTNTMGLSAQSNKRSSDLHDKEDSKSHSTRLESRITKHSLHNYGLAMDIYDAIARTLIPYVEYNERFKLKFMKQIHLDTTVTTFSGFPNIAQHIRTHLKMLCDEYSSNINGIVEIKSSVITNPTSKTDLIGGTPSIYLQNSHHGKIIQIIANILGIEICLVTSYIYEEMISVQPEDVLEKEPLYIAYNDVSKQYYMVDKPVDIRRNELSNHLHHLEQLIQKYHLTVIPKCSIGLSLFSATAQSLKNISIKNPMAENGIKKYFNMDSMFENELAILLRDMTYKQLKSNFDYYEAYVETKTKYFDIRRDSRSLIDCNYYRYQLEKVVLYALAHVIQCNMIVFNSDVKQSKPDVVRVDILIKDSSGIIILLKNESTQHYDSAIPNNSLRNLIGMTASKEPSVTENHHMNQSSEKTSTSNKPSENDQIYESIDPLSQQSDISYPSDPSTNIDSYSRQLSVHDNNMRLKDTYGDATRSTNTNEKKVDGKNSFLSKTREKFVTAFNKVVENGNLPKKSPIYHSNDQSSNNNSFSPSQTTATCSVSKYIELHSSPKTDEYSTFAQTPLQSNNISSVKRPAIITETISRQQQQQQQKLPNNNSYQNTPPKNLSKSDIISLPQRQINRPINTQQGAPTSVRHSSDIRQATENTRSHLIPYKDRQRSRNNLNMSFKSTVKKGNVFNGVTLEDVDDSEETDFTNSLTDDDTVILREINPQNPDNRLKNNTPRAKSSSYHYDHDTLRKQQRSKFVNGDFIDEEEAANDIRRYDDVNSLLSEHDLTLTDQQQAEDEEDIYISTTDIAQRERKQLQLFVKDKINHFNQINSSSATKFSPNKDMKYLYDTGNGKKQNVNDLANTKLPKSRDQQRNEIPTTTGKESQNHETTQLHHRTKVDSVEKLINSSTTKNDSSSMHSNRESHLIDKDAVLEVLGQSDILQRDRHILMKVLKQEDLISKEWQRLVYLLEEYVNNPKREKKER
ncbi:unnamed protein product [Didymodactylos carnosus]|uniref:Uncharacterized protein n=1 Tax=Didymodactylos carnosus TaxID=1234261 RepID=A0A813TIG2_9BILA|nr:unnamed protein product [Didymodactylos carnosus]CAF0885114.1 unnamed protein product [Didymodactylos carnosus]CAF3597115.1 unnamed protein product [Didymodactylos carnosus]CAF3668218.1 unnamed protein product [Didymodactylos carnosus]